MKGQLKRIAAIALFALLAIGLLPGSALAADGSGSGNLAAGGGLVAQSLTVQSTNASATAKLNEIKTQTGFKPGACGWSSWNSPYPSGWTNCKSGCWFFAANVCSRMFGCWPSGTSGYTLTDPGNFNKVGQVVDSPSANPSYSGVQDLLKKAYPGDVIQFKGGSGKGSWGSFQHTAIVESVDSDGVTIYQHGDDPNHVCSTRYSWSYFYNTYLDFDMTTSYQKGITLYHYKDYASKFPGGGDDTKGEMYPGNTVTTVPEGTEFIIRAAGNKNYVWDVQGASGYDGCNLQLFTRKDIPCQRFQFQKNNDGTYHIVNWSGNYGVYVGLCEWFYRDGTNVVTRYTCDWTINSWYVEQTPDGYYSFRNKYSGKYIDVSGGVYTDGRNLQQWNGGGVAAQKFILEAKMYPGNELVGASELNDKVFVIETAGAEGLVWDVAGGICADGTNLQLYTRNNTVAQKFVFYANDDGTFSIASWNGRSGTLVGLASDSYINGGNLAVRTFVREWDVNKWYVEKTPDGYYSFRNKFSSLYADVSGGVFASGRNMQQWSGGGVKAQKFKLIECQTNGIVDDLLEGDPGFVIRSSGNEDCVLTADSTSRADKCNAGLANYAASDLQRFIFWKEDDGTYVISNWVSGGGLALGLTEDTDANGSNVGMRTLVRTWSVNRWYVETTSDGYYSFRNKYSGKYLDVSMAFEDGANVQQWSSSDALAQKWILEPCDYYYTSLQDAEIMLSKDSYTYTGEAAEPSVTVKLNGNVVDPANYTIQYSDNIEVGTASVSVIGKKASLYDGSATTTFSIFEKPIDNASITGVNPSYTYTGDPITPNPQVVLDGKTLAEGSDYALSYFGSDGTGDAGLVVIGLGNYGGERYVGYTIEPIKVAKPVASSFVYDGSSHAGVEGDTGFTLVGEVEEASAGNYSASAQLDFGYAWDDGGFDDLELEWRIDPATVTDVALSESSYVCNGDVQRPSVSSVQAGGLVLGESDYDVSYSNEDSRDAGTYAVTVTGKGNFCGSRSATYVIEPGGPADGDRAAAEAAIAKVSAIGAVTLDSGDAIEAARQAYDSLTAEQKALVPSTVLEALINAEASYRGMVDEEAAAGKRAAAKVGGRLAAEVERAITSAPSDEGPAGSSFSALQARSSKQTKSSVALAWTRVPGAQGYTVYANRCGKGNRYVKLADAGGAGLSVASVAGKKVAKGAYYKFIVAAWRTVDGHKVVTAVSKAIHVATKGGRVGNYKKVKLSKKSAKLKKGKKLKLKAKPVAASKKLKVKKHRKVAFECSDPRVATVTAKGAVKAVGKGTCYVYAYSQSGTFARCKVTVK